MSSRLAWCRAIIRSCSCSRVRSIPKPPQNNYNVQNLETCKSSSEKADFWRDRRQTCLSAEADRIWQASPIELESGPTSDRMLCADKLNAKCSAMILKGIFHD